MTHSFEYSETRDRRVGPPLPSSQMACFPSPGRWAVSFILNC